MTKLFFKSCRYFTQHTGRLIEIAFKTNTSIDLVVVNNYSPHNSRSIEEIYKHFKQMKEITTDNEGKILMIMGDFNSRFHHRTEGESHTLGPYIYGKGKEVMDKIIERDMEGTQNRSLTLEWAMEMI